MKEIANWAAVALGVLVVVAWVVCVVLEKMGKIKPPPPTWADEEAHPTITITIVGDRVEVDQDGEVIQSFFV